MSGVAWWEVLGLSPRDDLRSIKRRYAQLLKQHRPDEDPQGFQQLREAYEAALRDQASEEIRPEVNVPDEVVTPIAEPDVSPMPHLEGLVPEELDRLLSEAELLGSVRASKSGYWCSVFSRA